MKETEVWIKLVVQHEDDYDDVFEIVDRVLDDATLQEAIVERAADDDNEIEVTSIVCDASPEAIQQT